jgi:aldehyde:ferredoxin oxidoreductase
MPELGGYTGKILRIDLTKGISKVTELEKDFAMSFLGGRGFNAKRMYDEISPGTDP